MKIWSGLGWAWWPAFARVITCHHANAAVGVLWRVGRPEHAYMLAAFCRCRKSGGWWWRIIVARTRTRLIFAARDVDVVLRTHLVPPCLARQVVGCVRVSVASLGAACGRRQMISAPVSPALAPLPIARNAERERDVHSCFYHSHSSALNIFETYMLYVCCWKRTKADYSLIRSLH